MATLKNSRAHNIGEQLTFLPVVSPVNRTLSPEKEKAEKILATSGRKCFELLERLSPPGSLARTLAALLIGRGGVVFEEVHAYLENKGYEVQSFLLPAAGVGARHRRERIWFIANTDNDIHTGRLVDGRNTEEKERGKGSNQNEGKTSFRQRIWVESTTSHSPITNTNGQGFQERQADRGRTGPENEEHQRQVAAIRDEWFTEPGICGKNHGISNRVDRIKGLGNAIVPQVAFEIFKAISVL